MLSRQRTLPPRVAGDGGRSFRARAIVGPVALAWLTAVVLGCAPTVKIETPEEPIVINLNVKIEHEIRVKVDDELDDVFAENDDLFGESE